MAGACSDPVRRGGVCSLVGFMAFEGEAAESKA